MTTTDWTELRAWAVEILAKQDHGLPLERREQLVVMVDTECRRAGLDLPPCGGMCRMRAAYHRYAGRLPGVRSRGVRLCAMN